MTAPSTEQRVTKRFFISNPSAKVEGLGFEIDKGGALLALSAGEDENRGCECKGNLAITEASIGEQVSEPVESS